ncbi:MAG: hypothetical protein AB7F97_09435 [Solirubrobacterales bacterium]
MVRSGWGGVAAAARAGGQRLGEGGAEARARRERVTMAWSGAAGRT